MSHAGLAGLGRWAVLESAALPTSHLSSPQRAQDWAGCRGPTADSRGYTCGLWQLLHSLAARLPEADNAGAVWLAAVRGFIKSYFQCSECAKHFTQHASKPEALAVATRRDAVLWVWRAHNIVNARLGAEEAAAEAAGKPGPATPHVQFPPAQLCPKCRRPDAAAGDDGPGAWDEAETHAFLRDYYSAAPEAALRAAAAGGGAGAARSSWTDAGLLVALVGGCLYAVLRKSGQYALSRKASFRSL